MMRRSGAQLDSSLLASFVMGAQPHGPIVTCAYCHEVDHSAAECTLALIQQREYARLPQSSHPRLPFPLPPTQLHQLLPTQMRQFLPAYDQRPVLICISWNKGKCILPGSCAFRHICAVCRTADHMVRDCDQVPADSPYKRQLQPPAKRSQVGRVGRVVLQHHTEAHPLLNKGWEDRDQE